MRERKGEVSPVLQTIQQSSHLLALSPCLHYNFPISLFFPTDNYSSSLKMETAPPKCMTRPPRFNPVTSQYTVLFMASVQITSTMKWHLVTP